MVENVENYFHQEVVPLVARRMPALVPEMTIQIIGSFSLGIADEHSDLDAVVYLPDATWKTAGADLQLLLDKEAPPFGVKTTHPGIVIWPKKWFSKLLTFVDGAEPAWEEETMERLHEMQHCIAISDPTGILKQLKEATTPDRFPAWLWQKRIIGLLRDVYQDHLSDLHHAIVRNLKVEEAIITGQVLTKIMHVGFMMAKQYYPWFTHLRWGFANLPAPIADLGKHIDHAACAQVSGDDKLAEIRSILESYYRYIVKNDLLPGLKLNGVDLSVESELEWAERFRAWKKPDWRNRITELQGKAKAAGEASDKWWIWSLWG